MKYLKPLILESKQVGIIYHFSGIWNLYEMLKFNNFKLKSQTHYISFTRNPIMYSPELLPSKMQTRIMIDGNKLSNKYKIEPFLDYRGVKREHGEAEEKINKINDIFLDNPLIEVDIKDCILEISILDEPLFRGYDDKHFKYAAKGFEYGKTLNSERLYPDNEIEKIITKHKEILDNIKLILKDKKYNFEINEVSRFTNPKYQDKYIINKLNI